MHMSDFIKEQLKKLDHEWKLKPRNLVDGDPQLYVQISSPLNGMLPSIAYLRLIRFAKPIFITSMVLSLLSLFGNTHVQDVVVAAVFNTISITLIKLLFYLNMLLYGLSFVIKQRNLSSSLQVIGAYLCDISFDCSSIGAGAILGIYPASAISSGFFKMTFSVIYLMVVFLIINSMTWGFANIRMISKRLSAHKDYRPWMKQSIGIVCIIIVAISLSSEKWKDVPALHPVSCPSATKAKN